MYRIQCSSDTCEQYPTLVYFMNTWVLQKLQLLGHPFRFPEAVFTQSTNQSTHEQHPLLTTMIS